jgi:hypothetical protein
MNELPQAHRDILSKAYAKALERHLKYMAQQQAKQTAIVQDCQPEKLR